MSKESRKIWVEKNRDKISQQHKEHYLENKETHKVRMKNWRQNNPEKSKEIIKNWEENNKDKNKKYHKKYDKIQKPIWYKNKYHTDVEFKMIELLRKRINSSLKNNSKSNSTKTLLGCTVQECRLHLEKQFKPEMTWCNHGKIWEIDHIKPCASFDLIKEEEQKKCFHFLNLQPLFKTTEIAESFGYQNEIGNRNKSNKVQIIKQ
jgi:hypothetical protein